MFIWQIKVAKTAKAKLCATTPSSVPQPKLCATTKALCHNQKQTIQEFGTSRFCAFVSLQGKTLFIWQIKVAKTAKAKLCATSKANYPRIRHQPNNAFVSLQGKTLFIWQIKVAKTAKAKLCATTKSKLSKNSAQAEFLSFVPLQRKTQFL